LAADRINVPVPDLVTPPGPPMVPLYVMPLGDVVASTAMVAVDPT
jgi:hypothetical protein